MDNNLLTNSAYTSQSTDKLLQVMECLAELRTPAKLLEISTRVNMSQPSVLRYLNAMINSGYVYKDEENARYALTWKVCRLSKSVIDNTGVRDIAAPFIREIAYSLNLAAALVVRRKFESVYIDLIEKPNRVMQSLQRIGKNAPLNSTSSGKLLLSSMSETALSDYLRLISLPKLTPNTIISSDILFSELVKIRQNGYSFDNEECEVGIRGVSTPVYDYSGRMVAALSAFGPVHEVSEAVIQEQILPLLFKITAVVSERLGAPKNCIISPVND